MNAVKCSVMTGQHDRSFFFHTVESLSVHNHDNGDRNTSEQFLRDTLRENLIVNAIFFIYVYAEFHTLTFERAASQFQYTDDGETKWILGTFKELYQGLN